MRQSAFKVSKETLGMIKYFREGLAGKAQVRMDGIMQLQASAPQPLPEHAADDGYS